MYLYAYVCAYIYVCIQTIFCIVFTYLCMNVYVDHTWFQDMLLADTSQYVSGRQNGRDGERGQRGGGGSAAVDVGRVDSSGAGASSLRRQGGDYMRGASVDPLSARRQTMVRLIERD